ncbi:hypothetical protein DEO72_LG11g2498 [Vigna unguiculata]|uniref:Uncharacterized protein n=1 Tax=Vigna unguiculata TaxID=3917 RepID=A0A4D6NUM5_VIGUN|nr:hypothetical protein DEO72_LG11g2498 [Vigna unguiculata]
MGACGVARKEKRRKGRLRVDAGEKNSVCTLRRRRLCGEAACGGWGSGEEECVEAVWEKSGRRQMKTVEAVWEKSTTTWEKRPCS